MFVIASVTMHGLITQVSHTSMTSETKQAALEMTANVSEGVEKINGAVYHSEEIGDVNGIKQEINGIEEAATSSSASIPQGSPDAALSTCLVCGKMDRSVEFILPDRYCSQSCADKHGDSIKFGKPKHGSKGVISSHNAPGKRKKKRASYLSAYEEDFHMDAIDDRKGSRTVKVRPFAWRKFLIDENLKAASDDLFIREPPVTFVNTFSVGSKMEGIDPSHPSKFCVLTVAEVKGHRIRLHFDGYPECYDFWTYANSDEIFPVGWCREMGKELQAPKGIIQENFCWEVYLQHTKSTAAPHALFTVCSKEFLAKKPAFEVGDKLEAVDIKNKNTYICVASVADTYGDKILVHFDGWEDNYDYWCYYNCPHIHHVGWCQENLKTLSAPNGHPDPSSFTWESYLEETNSRAAPHESFEPLAVHRFTTKMGLEVVDRRNPTLVRVAEIIQVADSMVKIHFSGWDNKYDYWEDVDSPDLHPVGWCQRTLHPLQPPITPLDIVNYSGPCPTIGCYGHGHVKGAKYSAHHSLCGCPYSDANLNRDNIIVDRLGCRKVEILERSPSVSPSPPHTSHCSTPGCDGSGHVTGKFPNHFSTSGCPLAEVNQNKVMKNLSIDTSPATTATARKRRTSCVKGNKVKRVKRETSMDPEYSPNTNIKQDLADPAGGDNPSNHLRASLPSAVMPPPPVKESPQAILQNDVHNSVFLPSIPTQKQKMFPPCWERNIKLLPGIDNVPFSQVPSWSAQQVAQFLSVIAPSITTLQQRYFIEQKIDGCAFLLLTQSDITSILKLKLGPAIKIYNSVLVIKKALGQL